MFIEDFDDFNISLDGKPLKKEKKNKGPKTESIKISPKERLQMIEIINSQDNHITHSIPRTYTKTNDELNFYIPEKWKY